MWYLWSLGSLCDSFKDAQCGQWNQYHVILNKLSFFFPFFINSDKVWVALEPFQIFSNFWQTYIGKVFALSIFWQIFTDWFTFQSPTQLTLWRNVWNLAQIATKEQILFQLCFGWGLHYLCWLQNLQQYENFLFKPCFLNCCQYNQTQVPVTDIWIKEGLNFVSLKRRRVKRTRKFLLLHSKLDKLTKIFFLHEILSRHNLAHHDS